MDYNVTFRKAALMGISPQAAARMRIRYLQNEVHTCLEYKSDVSLFWANKAIKEIHHLAINMNKKRKITASADRINDADIESAKQYPVGSLINFQNGVSIAWCHNDKKPSLWYASRRNLAICPVCDKKFNPIDILMGRDGMTFIEAVKNLRS